MAAPGALGRRAASPRGGGDLVVFHPARVDHFVGRLAAAEDGGPTWPGRVVACRNGAEVAAAAPGMEVLCATGSGFPVAELKRAPHLRWVHSLGAGVDWMVGPQVPTALRLPRQVKLTRSIGLHGTTMAEFVLAYLLAFNADLPRGLRQKAEHRWQWYRVPRIAGKRLGVAGLGHIGREVARLASGLGMEVSGLQQRSRPCRWARRIFTPDQLPAFLAGLDFLVIVLPLTPVTRGMFGEPELSAMKEAAVVANIGRGPVIDEAALIDALRRKVIAGAALDVFEREPLPPSSPLWDMPNVLITPHMAGQANVTAACEFFIKNLERYLRGQPLLGGVSRRRGY